MEQTAKQYPNIKFGIVDTIATGKNIRSVYSKEYEATFLVGYEAANMSKSHKVGVVSAEQVPLMEKYWGGYLEGINYAQKTEGIHTTMINRFVGSWDDPALSKTLTLQEISQGADFIYAASAGGEFGQYAACAEKHVYCVGLDNDYRGINPYVIDSEIKDVAPETEQLVVDFAHDASPWSTSTAYGLGNGMSLASVSDPKPISTNALGKPLLAKLKKLTAEIESGAVVLKDPCGC
jgi:basic membrane protein A